MGAVPSVASRTAIELGLENRDANNDTVLRTAGLVQIPLWNAENPLEARGETTELNRIKTGLAGDGVTVGAMSYAIAAEFYIFGSGIANLPPDYFQIIQACGFAEIRLASIAASAGSPTATSQGSGGALGAGGYAYKYTVLFKDDGTTPATTRANAAFESLGSTSFTDATTVATDSIQIASLPSAGIKRLYRTIAGNSASTDLNDFQFVAEIANGVTSYLDVLADINLGRTITKPGTTAVGTFAAADDATAGGLDDGGVYKYVFSVLYKKDGTVSTTVEEAAYEAPITVATAVQIDLTAGKTAAALSNLPSSGMKRIYRTSGGVTTDYKFVDTVASGTTTYIDTVADADRGHDFVAYADKAIYLPVSEYLDFPALTILSYLDSRKYPAKSCRGSFSMEAPASGNALVRFTQEGVYNTSTKIANPTLISNPGAIPQVCAVGLSVIPESTGVARTIRALSLGIEVPRTPGARRDANASCDNSGITEYQINGPVRPRFTLSFEVPNEIGDAGDTDWIDDFKTSEFFSFQFHIGDTARKKVYFQNMASWGENRYLAQLTEPPRFDRDQATGNRIFNGTFELTEHTGIQDSFLYLIHQ